MITVSGVYKTYLSGRGVTNALIDVSFSLDSGKSMTLVGPSGSGKTTLLHCIGGLEGVDRGSVRCFDLPIHALSPKALSRFQRNRVGFVFQFGNLLSYLTIGENIAFPLVLNGASRRQIGRRVEELLEKTGLSGFGAAFPHELSGGELQRAAVARAMSHTPKLFLADEPTASLDSTTGKQLIQMILSLSADQSCTVVIATHDTELIRLSDKTASLKDGKITGERHASDF